MKLKNNILYPSHYLSAPALSRDAMLSMTKVELELILDADMCFLFRKLLSFEPLSLMTQNKSQNILYTWTLIIYMVVLNSYQQTDSNG